MPASDMDRAEHERWLRLVESQQLASVMNDTRWRRAIAALEQIPGYKLRFRVKAIDRDCAPSGLWIEGIEHAGWLRYIEWMDVNPRQDLGQLSHRDFTDNIVAALRRAEVRLTVEDGTIRIWGYLRPGCSPDFL